MSGEIKVGQRLPRAHRASAGDGRRTGGFYVMMLAAAALAVMAMGRFRETWIDLLVLVGLAIAVVAGMFVIRRQAPGPDPGPETAVTTDMAQSGEQSGDGHRGG